MAIYEARGFSNSLHLYDKSEPFEYFKKFRAKKVPDGVSIEEYKRTEAPYCISGQVTAEADGTYKRNNQSLQYRDLIFLDYDSIPVSSEEFKKIVDDRLFGYSYITYPTINHRPESPRFRLVVKPSGYMDEVSYKKAVEEIAQAIALPYDHSSLTWSQLQGLPVTRGDPEAFDKVVVDGLPYPVDSVGQNLPDTRSYAPRSNNQRSMTMRIIDTLFNGFGDEGGRNVAMTKFIGLLLNKWVDCDIPTAYELTRIANSRTLQPLKERELDTTFSSIVRAETRKRGSTLSN